MQASVERTLVGKAWFGQMMAEFGFDVLHTEGNFLHVRFGEQASVVHKALQGKVLYRKDFECAALAGYSRFSMAPKEVLTPVVHLINQAVKG